MCFGDIFSAVMLVQGGDLCVPTALVGVADGYNANVLHSIHVIRVVSGNVTATDLAHMYAPAWRIGSKNRTGNDSRKSNRRYRYSPALDKIPPAYSSFLHNISLSLYLSGFRCVLVVHFFGWRQMRIKPVGDVLHFVCPLVWPGMAFAFGDHEL